MIITTSKRIAELIPPHFLSIGQSFSLLTMLKYCVALAKKLAGSTTYRAFIKRGSQALQAETWEQAVFD